MKDEYFTPIADMLAFNYANVVSASFTPTVPNQHNPNQCSVVGSKNKPEKCGGNNQISPTKKGKNNNKC